MFSDFKPEIKTLLLVALVAVAISVGGILLLKAFQGQLPILSIVQQAPSLERIIPDEAPIGAEVLVIGSGFTPTKNSLQFGYGGLHTINNLTSSDGKKITFTLPSIFDGCNAKGCFDIATRPVPGQTYEVAVINTNGTSNRVKFTVVKDTTSSEIDTSGWQTYRSEEFGFEVRYPEEWKVKEKTLSLYPISLGVHEVFAYTGPSGLKLLKSVIFNNRSENSVDLMEVRVDVVRRLKEYPLSGYLPEEVTLPLNDEYKDFEYQIGENKVNIRKKFPDENSFTLGSSALIKNDLYFYLLAKSDERDNHKENLLLQILSTFRFIE